jgi:N-carbamoylputrescine amidase
MEEGSVRPLHRKHYFPDEPGWFECDWYSADQSGFQVSNIQGIQVGVLLCTEAMFSEHARAYGKQHAALIAIPRSSGSDLVSWKTAGAMASIVSGAYVVSSNRAGVSKRGTRFGGGGFAFAPHGRLLGVTDAENPVQSFELDVAASIAAQREYPCYIPERT